MNVNNYETAICIDCGYDFTRQRVLTTRCDSCKKIFRRIRTNNYNAKYYKEVLKRKRGVVEKILVDHNHRFWTYKANSMNSTYFKRTQNTNAIYLAKDLRELYYKQNCCCYYCKSYLPLKMNKNDRNKSLSFDHVIPGLEDITNIVASCMSCNRIKNNATLEQLENIVSGIKKHIEG